MSSTVMTVFGQGQTAYFERKAITLSTVAEQFGSVKLTPHHRVIFNAPTSNSGIIWVGRTKAEAELGNFRFELGAGSSLVMSVTDINVLWFMPSIATEVIQVAVERGNV